MERSLNKLEQSLINHTVARALNTGTSAVQLGAKTVHCDTHGDYESSGSRYFGNREFWTRCPDCTELQLAAERQAEADKKANEARATLERLIGNACIPQRFIGRSFDNFVATTDEQKNALKVSREYVESFADHYKRGTGLIMSGMPGTGKSHLAAAILQGIMPKHCGMYTTCMNIIRNVRGTWRKDSEQSETEVLRIYGTADLLVIDEIGVQYGTDGEQTILFDVMDRRYREMMPTILLTNQAKAGFKQFIGDRSFDRLVETSRWVAFDWPSHRATARRESAV